MTWEWRPWITSTKRRTCTASLITVRVTSVDHNAPDKTDVTRSQNLSGKSRRVNRTCKAVRAHTAPLSVVRSVGALTSARGRQHPRLLSLGIPSILHRQPLQLPTPPSAFSPSKAAPPHARARAIEAFSNFRSVEAPGWTGGIRFQRRRLQSRTKRVQWKPLLTTTCAWQLSTPRQRQRQRRRRLHGFLPAGCQAQPARSISTPTKWRLNLFISISTF